MMTIDDVAALCAVNSLAVIALCVMFCILANYVDKHITKERKAKERAELIEDVKCALRNGEDHDMR